jgi:uncharacterized protein YqeY
MTLKEKISKDYMIAFKEKNAVSKNLLSVIKGEIQTVEKNKSVENLSDEDVMKILTKTAKSLKETISLTNDEKSKLEYEKVSVEKVKYLTLNIMDTNIISKIKEKFDIDNKKTYNPPSLSVFENMKEENLYSLIVGFIDGDGSIRPKGNSFSLQVKCHSSWLSILDIFAKKINETTNAKLNSAGYAYFTITNHKSLKKLKRFVLDNNLPVLKRKWDIIDFNFIPNKEAHDRNFKTFEKLFIKFKNMDYYEEKLNKIIYENGY